MRAMDQLEESGGDIAGIMGVRQRLGEIRPSEGSDWEAAQHVRDSIDNYIETLPDTEIVQGGAGGQQFTQAMLNHARSSWRAYAKLDQVHTALEIGSHRAAVSGTGANSQNAMRQRIREILDSENKSRGFSPETRQQMEDIVVGSWLQNASSRYAGKVRSIGSGFRQLHLVWLILAARSRRCCKAVAIPATIAKYLRDLLDPPSHYDSLRTRSGVNRRLERR